MSEEVNYLSHSILEQSNAVNVVTLITEKTGEMIRNNLDWNEVYYYALHV